MRNLDGWFLWPSILQKMTSVPLNFILAEIQWRLANLPFPHVFVEAISDTQIGPHLDLPGEETHTVLYKGTRLGDSLVDAIYSEFG